MDKEQIIEVIKKNPELSYDEMKIQAVTAGIPVLDFNVAWNEIYGKKSRMYGATDYQKKYIIFLLIYAVVGIEIMILYTALGPGYPLWMMAIEETAAFALNILIIQITVKLLGLQGTIYKATGIAILSSILNYMVGESGFALAFMGLGALFIFLSFYIIMKAYDIGVLRTILFMIVDGILTVAAVFLVHSLYNMHVYFL